MQIESWTKLAVVVLVCVAAAVLGYAAKIDSQAVVALLSAALGYVFGNSHGVASVRRAVAEAQQAQAAEFLWKKPEVKQV